MYTFLYVSSGKCFMIFLSKFGTPPAADLVPDTSDKIRNLCDNKGSGLTDPIPKLSEKAPQHVHNIVKKARKARNEFCDYAYNTSEVIKPPLVLS